MAMSLPPQELVSFFRSRLQDPCMSVIPAPSNVSPSKWSIVRWWRWFREVPVFPKSASGIDLRWYSGVNPSVLPALMLAPMVCRYYLTDQECIDIDVLPKSLPKEFSEPLFDPLRVLVINCAYFEPRHSYYSNVAALSGGIEHWRHRRPHNAVGDGMSHELMCCTEG